MQPRADRFAVAGNWRAVEKYEAFAIGITETDDVNRNLRGSGRFDSSLPFTIVCRIVAISEEDDFLCTGETRIVLSDGFNQRGSESSPGRGIVAIRASIRRRVPGVEAIKLCLDMIVVRGERCEQGWSRCQGDQCQAVTAANFGVVYEILCRGYRCLPSGRLDISGPHAAADIDHEHNISANCQT